MAADPLAPRLRAEAERHCLNGGASLAILRKVGAVLGLDVAWVQK